MTAVLAALLVAVVAGAHVQLLRREFWRRRVIVALTAVHDDEAKPNRAERRRAKRDEHRRSKIPPKWWLTRPTRREGATAVAARTRMGRCVEVLAVPLAFLLLAITNPAAALGERVRADEKAVYAFNNNVPDPIAAAMPASGSGISVHVNHFTKQTGTGNQDIDLTANSAGTPADLTAAAAGSWAVMFWTTGSVSASGTWGGHYFTSLGFVANGGGSISQFSVSAAADDAAGSSNTARRMAAAAITITDQNGAGNKDEATFTSWLTATSMRINWGTQNLARAAVVNYMIVSGLTGAKVVNWTMPATAINKSVTGVGFNPDLVLHAAGNFATVPSSVAAANLGFGVMNRHGQQFSNAISAQDAVNPSNTSRYQQTDACITETWNNETVLAQGHFVSMDADGFTVNFSTTDSGSQVMSLCLDGVSSKIGAFTKVAGTSPHSQVIDTRQGFTPKGALFSNMSETPKAAPLAHAEWALGATDGTNQRVVALSDKDAISPTEAKSLWRNDASISVPTIGSSEYQRASVTAFGLNSVTLGWTYTSEYATEHLYLLIGDAGTDTFPAKVAV